MSTNTNDTNNVNDDGADSNLTPEDKADELDFATSDEQDLSLTFSYDPQGSLEELFGIGEEQLLHAFDRALARIGVTESVEVSVLITDDEGIQRLNREYRGKDEATDVLSFPLLDHPLVEAPADQLWQPNDEDDDQVDGLDDLAALDALDDADVADDAVDADGQSLKGMIVLMGDEEDFFDEPEVEMTHLGDIAISRETTLRQARQAGHSPAFELAFLFVHGVLHLVGFDDHTDAGYQAMVAHQEAALAQAGVTR